ncbi:hypothetical protein AMJ40_06270 [candidate division TA06 bacterium DG_26]|uniref:Cation/H+ exchanger transmembrane domain-containing protein n=1 Tax=candidate division TA06 bacterium DG_26 TaxID=1703771 RepID=A0A0S7WHQ0_UNCT6|nr:MAG: hypothetical protein AMJ40_06270 [candidate division TA06 bacterium DG_26]
MSTLLSTAVIIISAKVGSHVLSKLKQPPVLGMLLLGLLLGPSGLNIVRSNEVLKTLADIGVIILLFMAGLETDLAGMRKEGRVSILTATGGVILPFFSGFLIGRAFHFNIGESLFLGTALTATSVSIPVMTLFDLDRLRGPEGRAILGASVMDDVMAVLILAFTAGLLGGGSKIVVSLGEMSLFFVLACIIGLFAFQRIMQFAMRLQASQALLAVAFGILLIYASAADLAGIAPITGAYVAGVFLGRTAVRRRLLSGMDTIGHALFISIFFVHVGLQEKLQIGGGQYLFLVLYILVGIVGKFVGCGLGATLGGLRIYRSVRVGIGMIPRGEVALAVASIAMSRGLVGAAEFSSTVLLVVVTALITPPLLKWSFAERGETKELGEENDVPSHDHTE